MHYGRCVRSPEVVAGGRSAALYTRPVWLGSVTCSPKDEAAVVRGSGVLEAPENRRFSHAICSGVNGGGGGGAGALDEPAPELLPGAV